MLSTGSTLLLLLTVVPSAVMGQGPPSDSGSGPPDSGGGGPPGMSSSTASSAVCDETGADADYSEEFSGNGTTTVRNVASTTGCPNHINWPLNPNYARHLGQNVTIPAYPRLFADDGTTDLSEAAMSTGIMLNGVALFSSWALDPVVDYDTTAFAIEGDTFDPCGGHATMEGNYHYHGTAGCLQEQAMVEAGTTASEHSPLLGWSFDGFPVYGQLGPGGVEMLMCDNDGADATYCLDNCSGYEGEIDDDDFLYRYYLSCGFDEKYFPFTTNCYRGCCPDDMTCDSQVDVCGDSPEDGYTAAYVPELGTDLSEVYDAALIEGDDTELINSTTYIDCSLYLGSAEATVYTDDDGTATDASWASSVLSSTTIVLATTAMSAYLLASV